MKYLQPLRKVNSAGKVLSLSCTPIATCRGALCGGCKFGGKACYAIRIYRQYPSVRGHVDRVRAALLDGSIVHHVAAELDSMRRLPLAIRLFGSSGGDVEDQAVLDRLTVLAILYPTVRWYLYTKSLDLDWSVFDSLANTVRVQSFGGRFDALIDLRKPHARVFNSRQELLDAGYVDGSEDDAVALNETVKIGLIAH